MLHEEPEPVFKPAEAIEKPVVEEPEEVKPEPKPKQRLEEKPAPEASRSYASIIGLKSEAHPHSQPAYTPSPQPYTQQTDTPRETAKVARRSMVNGYSSSQPHNTAVEESQPSSGNWHSSHEDRRSGPPQGRRSDYGGERRDFNGGDKREYHPDAHQVFVGNLPQWMLDEQLREKFKVYGNIVDVRVNLGKAKNGGMGANTPNFGFITFSNSDCVKQCLEDRPILADGHRLNVEEKLKKYAGGGQREQRGGMRGGVGGRGGFNRVERGGRSSMGYQGMRR